MILFLCNVSKLKYKKHVRLSGLFFFAAVFRFIICQIITIVSMVVIMPIWRQANDHCREGKNPPKCYMTFMLYQKLEWETSDHIIFGSFGHSAYALTDIKCCWLWCRFSLLLLFLVCFCMNFISIYDDLKSNICLFWCVCRDKRNLIT